MEKPNMLGNFEEIIQIASRRIIAHNTLSDSDRVSLYQAALALVGESILANEDLVTLIHPEVLAALHQLAFLADPSTDRDTLNAMAEAMQGDID